MTPTQIRARIAVLYGQLMAILSSSGASLPMTLKQQKIRDTALSLIGKHLTLDPNVPAALGCAEAVSYVLRAAGCTIPDGGQAGTAGLYAYLPTIGFIEVTTPQAGDIIFGVSGTSINGSPHGHVGIVLPNGLIASNDSNTGLFKQNYTIATWTQFFMKIEGFPIHYLRLV